MTSNPSPSSWTVKECLKQQERLSALSCVYGKPQNMKIVGNSTLYWLEGSKQELFAVSLDDPEDKGHKVIVTSEVAAAGDAEGNEKPLSKEEELLRERLRSRVTGISSYTVRESDGAVFFFSGPSFSYYHPKFKKVISVLDSIDDPVKAALVKENAVLTLNLTTVGASPFISNETNNSTVQPSTFSFVCKHNIYLGTIIEHPVEADGVSLAVTIEKVTSIGEENRECGVADYIMQEEFSHMSGLVVKKDYVLYTYTDTSMLNQVTLVNGKGELEKMPYPRVGDPNAVSVLVVFDRSSGLYRVVPPKAMDDDAPWVEYIPRFGFKNDDTIFWSVLSRDQEKWKVLSAKITDLPTVSENELLGVLSHCSGHTENSAAVDSLTLTSGGGGITVELEQEIPFAWVDTRAGNPITFGKDFDLTVHHAIATPSADSHIFIRPHGGDKDSWKQLTDGCFSVFGVVKQVGSMLYFISNRDDRLEKALYAIELPPSIGSFEKPYSAADLQRVSPPETSVSGFQVSDACVCAVIGSATKLSELHIIARPSSSKKIAARVVTTEWNVSTRVIASTSGIVFPKIFTVENTRGVPISACLFVPPQTLEAGNMPPGGWPAVLYMYGGPGVQLAQKYTMDIAFNVFLQGILATGVCVIVSDNQMCNANGLRALSICKNNMGQFEIDDYKCVVSTVTNRSSSGWASNPDCFAHLPESWCIDPKRVAIAGWSYGGYATLLAMSQAPDVFKLGFSGAPVGDWRLYDTGYTERYMGLLYADGTSRSKAGVEETDAKGNPKTHSDAYQKSSIKAFVDGFPDEGQRVFIAHGLLDENVHFSNSCDVVDAMTFAGKPYSMQVYPGERHGLVQRPHSRRYYNAVTTYTIQQLL